MGTTAVVSAAVSAPQDRIQFLQEMPTGSSDVLWKKSPGPVLHAEMKWLVLDLVTRL